jgi:hypothetical protein
MKKYWKKYYVFIATLLDVITYLLDNDSSFQEGVPLCPVEKKESVRR